MRKRSLKVLALVLAMLMAVLLPMQVFADAEVEYISEIKIGYGESADAAKAALDGYTVLADDSGNPVDLNQNAGGGMGSKGERVVYLGYKTTTESGEAVTDLALMNMKGGYSVQDYEALMATQMKSQIIPFVENFQVAINEYRENYASDNEENQQRAKYIHDALNKFKDDDCGGAGLGDLLLKETKYEMGDEAYNALSDEEKNQHADILTILAQSNGKATLLMENLLTRAADTNEESWIDRFTTLTYEDMVDETELPPSQAAKELAKLYDDDANVILGMWDELRDSLLDYDNAVERLETADAEAAEDAINALDELDESSTDEEIEETLAKVDEQGGKALDAIKDTETVALYNYFANTEYSDGTLLDFFTQETEAVEENITALYPLVASMTDGQRAGLQFVTLRQLSTIAITDSEGYKAADIEALKELSIYDGVDRAMYEKGGVALTSDALRTQAAQQVPEESSLFSGWTIAGYVLTGISAAAMIGSAIFSMWSKSMAKAADNTIKYFEGFVGLDADAAYDFTYHGQKVTADEALNISRNKYQYYTSASSVSKYMAIGFGVAMVAFAAASTYLTYQDMKAYYQVDFTPIPHFMVDEKDLISYNEKGEKVILKNQSAYYKVAETNRASGDEFYDILGTCNDLNGGVGKQWLALYVATNEAEDPIIASSLKAVVNDANLPSGYETGIHMFGSEAAFNLNNSLYVWNSSAPSVFIYFQRDAGKVTKNAGSTFSSGSVAIASGGGVAVGAIGMAFVMVSRRKKKEQAAE